MNLPTYIIEWFGNVPLQQVADYYGVEFAEMIRHHFIACPSERYKQIIGGN